MNSSAQDITDKQYYDSLYLELKMNINVEEVKIYNELYRGGNPKGYAVLVKYRDDPGNNYWLAGHSVGFHENGMIKGIDNINCTTHVIQDTSKFYTKDGYLRQLYIYSRDYSDTSLATPIFKSKKNRYYYYVPDNFQVKYFYYTKTKEIAQETSYVTFYDPKRNVKKHGAHKKYDYEKNQIEIKTYDKGVLVNETINKIE